MSKLSEYLGQNLSGEVSVDDATREYFSTDGSILRIRPQVVVFPRTADDIRKVMRFSWRLAEKGLKLPITARGYGADTTGASIGSGAVLVFPAHMTKVLELDTKIKKIRVQAGINGRTLQEILATHGLTLPIYPTNLKFSTIGGVISNNIAGPKGLKFGSMRGFTDRLEVVLSNGEIIQTGRLNKAELSKKKGLSTLEGEIYRELDALIDENASAIEKLSSDLPSNVGYALQDVKQRDGSFDLTPLLVGSQGTLAIVSQAILKLEPKPAQTALMAVVLNDLEGLGEIVSAVKSADPSEFEFIDGAALKWIQKNTGAKPLNTLKVKDPAGVLIIEFDDGDSAHSKTAKKVYKMLENVGAVVELAETVDDKEDIWAIRYALDALYNNCGDGKQVVTFADAVVPIKKVEKLYQVAQKLIKMRKFTGFISGRIGAGNITISALLNLDKIGDRQAAFGTAKDFYAVAGKLGGEIAGDNGDGRLRQTAARGQYDDELLGIFEKVKDIFDPKGILNPGVILDTSEASLIAKLNPNPAVRFLDCHPRL